MNGGEMSGMGRTRRRVGDTTAGVLAGLSGDALAGTPGGALAGLQVGADVGAPSEALVSGLSLVLALSFTIPFPWMEADSGAVREG
jgi:hypothetical protein